MTFEQGGLMRGGSSDWEGGEDGPGYDSTYYCSGYTCRMKDMRRINDYTYILTVYDVVSEYPDGKEEIRDGIRFVYSGGCPFREGMIVTIYTPAAPLSAIPAAIRDMYETASARKVNDRMPCCVLVYGSGYNGFFE